MQGCCVDEGTVESCRAGDEGEFWTVPVMAPPVEEVMVLET